MTDLLAKPRRSPSSPDPARTLDMLATILIVVLTIGILFVAREILVPIAIAILMSFVLSPLVRLVRRTGLGKTLSVGFVVTAAFIATVGVGAILAKQISDLAADAPSYQETVGHKIDEARAYAAGSPILAKLNATIAGIGQMTPGPAAPAKATTAPESSSGTPAPDGPAKVKPPMPVEIVSPTPGVLSLVQMGAGAAATPLATTAFVAIFIIFILMQREDLRNRFIRLVGFGDLHRTTLAMDEAGSRLARYFLAQVLLNISFGLVVTVALALIGVPSAILWGIVAMFMRFVPYIGAVGAAIFPVVMAAAAGTGWSMVIETLLLFVVVELLVGQIVEPLVYGHNTGISPIAVVVSATFWTWLWGPVGLVLSTPMTVCLVVLGRHVERLAFLDIVLGNAPALTLVESFYQRLLAGDASEIAEHADTFLRERPILDYCDEVAMKALLMGQDDASRGALSEEKQADIRDMMRDLVTDLADREEEPDDAPREEQHAGAEGTERASDPALMDRAAVDQAAIDPAWTTDGAVLCIAARTPLDEAAAHILADLLGRQAIGARVDGADSLTDRLKTPDSKTPDSKTPEGKTPDVKRPNVKTPEFESPERLGDPARPPRLIILSTLDADLKIAQARFAVRRIKRYYPNVPVAVAFWMAVDDDKRLTGLCADVRCDVCVATLPAAIALCLERAGRTKTVEAEGGEGKTGEAESGEGTVFVEKVVVETVVETVSQER